MEDLKLIVASNIINLRKEAGMTQAELASKLSYSDKSVSKWERAEALPDVYVLKSMAEIFGVTVDHIIYSHASWIPPVKKNILSDMDAKTITEICMMGIGFMALLIFVILWILGNFAWITFVYAMPVALTTLLVLHSIWQEGRFNYIIIGALVFSVFSAVYFSFYIFAGQNFWQLFLVVFPGELIVYLYSRFGKREKKA